MRKWQGVLRAKSDLQLCSWLGGEQCTIDWEGRDGEQRGEWCIEPDSSAIGTSNSVARDAYAAGIRSSWL